MPTFPIGRHEGNQKKIGPYLKQCISAALLIIDHQPIVVLFSQNEKAHISVYILVGIQTNTKNALF